MPIEKINFHSGVGFEIHKLEIEFLNRFCDSITDNVETVVIREQWLEENEYNDTIRAFPTTVKRLINVQMLDEGKRYTHNRQFDEYIALGHFPNSDYYINFLAYMFYKKMKEITYSAKFIDTAFMCLNGKPHYHRQQIFANLKNNNLLDKGFVSFNAHGNPMRDGKKTISYKIDNEKNGNIIPSDFNVLDYGRIDYWNRHFLNIVSETLHDPDSKNYFLTEKTYKPIYGYKPFLIYAPNGAKQSLNYIGIEEYNNDFKDICDLDLYDVDNIIPFIKILASQHYKYFRKKYISLLPKILHNRNVFLNFAKEQERKYNHMTYRKLWWHKQKQDRFTNLLETQV